jgi:predicted amidohydrolase
MTVQRLGQRAGLLGGRNADTFWLGSPWFADDFRARGFLRLEGALAVEAKTRPAFGIACVQFEPVIGEVDANLDAMEARIRRAHADGAALIVLPELADSGYVFGRSARRLAAIAQELGIHIVSGLAERDGKSFFNSAILCGPEGYIGRYRKLHLWNREKLFFAAGDLGLPVFDTALGRIGIAICYDGWFPEVFRQMALAGAELVCIPTNWVPMPGQDRTMEPMANVLHKAAAHSNALYIACADRIGIERGQPFIGSSLIVGPTGRPIAGPAAYDTEEIVTATISLGDVKASRTLSERNDVIGDRRPDVYG